jgi:hypothetical protein
MAKIIVYIYLQWHAVSVLKRLLGMLLEMYPFFLRLQINQLQLEIFSKKKYSSRISDTYGSVPEVVVTLWINLPFAEGSNTLLLLAKANEGRSYPAVFIYTTFSTFQSREKNRFKF